MISLPSFRALRPPPGRGFRIPAALVALVALGACGDAGTQPDPSAGPGYLSVRVALSRAAVAALVVEVEGSGIATPLVFNLPVAAGSAAGELEVPPGEDRRLTFRAFDAAGRDTHRARRTVDVPAGGSGTPLAVTLRSHSVLVSPADTLLEEGDSVDLSGTVVDSDGETVGPVEAWVSMDPEVVSVTGGGVARALRTGETRVVAVYGSLGGSAAVRVEREAPTVPQDLVAEAVSGSRIELSWSPSTDDEGVEEYRVYRDGVLLATVSGTEHADIGLRASTEYAYAVLAVDELGHESALSEVASATTPAVPGTDLFPNQPGWGRIGQCNLSQPVPSMDGTSANRVALVGCPTWETSNGSRYPDGRMTSRRLVDPEAPVSPDTIWDILFAGGQVFDGVGPGSFFHFLYDYRDGWDGSIYWGFSMKLSENWIHHPTVQKLVHVVTDNLPGTNQSDEFILSISGNGGTLELYVGGRYRTANQPGAVRVEDLDGEWMTVELQWDAPIGRARWWINGVLQADHVGLPRPPRPWAHTFFDPTYGGRSDLKMPADQFIYLDHLLFGIP